MIFDITTVYLSTIKVFFSRLNISSLIAPTECPPHQFAGGSPQRILFYPFTLGRRPWFLLSQYGSLKRLDFKLINLCCMFLTYTCIPWFDIHDILWKKKSALVCYRLPIIIHLKFWSWSLKTAPLFRLDFNKAGSEVHYFRSATYLLLSNFLSYFSTFFYQIKFSVRSDKMFLAFLCYVSNHLYCYSVTFCAWTVFQLSITNWGASKGLERFGTSL